MALLVLLIGLLRQHCELAEQSLLAAGMVKGLSWRLSHE
jgi:hypothetical protein